jgi:bacterioferritin-associated ferredoxin
MYVCICRAVTEKRVQAIIDKGDATTVDEVTQACGAGGDCGGCIGTIEEMIESHLERANECDGKFRVPLGRHRAA